MSLLHRLTDFIDTNFIINNSFPTYYYQGYSDGKLLQLPRTQEVELIAYGLMRQLATDQVYSREGKMYGILLVELPDGEKRIIKAFSGLLNGCSVVEGWVPPISGREQIVLEETHALAELEVIKQELIQLKQLTQREEFVIVSLEFETRLQEMSKRHQMSKKQRDEQRQLLHKSLTELELELELDYPFLIAYKASLPAKQNIVKQYQRLRDCLTAFVMTTIYLNLILNIELEKLKEASRQDGIEKKLLKRQRDRVLQPLEEIIKNADMQIRELKQQRQQISRKLQAKMHAAYSVMNFLGNSSNLQQLMSQIPTGTGDCCAVKLLDYAAKNQLKPIAIAEFWWGESTQDKVPGKFYGACVERCQPLMGFLLSGLPSNPNTNKDTQTLLNSAEVDIIYQDKWLIAVNKPAGLLSVPGRYYHNQDSILSRLINLCPNGKNITAVHRLDMDTSGILLLAKDIETSRLLNKQFAQRLVSKVYEAILAGNLITQVGTIELPLWGNPENRPYQQVNYEHGKPCTTKFQILKKQGNYTRVEFLPVTGRTHQLRVHAADAKGLGTPILGDQLYGCHIKTTRLYLHARELTFEHPYLEKTIHLKIETPF